MAGHIFALTLLLALMTRASHAYQGWGTAYSGDGQKDATGRNACGFGNLGSYFENYYAALPLSSFQSSYCGRCLRAKGLQPGASGQYITVKVVDQCAGCQGGDVDFSTRALKDITGFSWDKKRITWEWTDCGSAGSSDVVSADAVFPSKKRPRKPKPGRRGSKKYGRRG